MGKSSILFVGMDVHKESIEIAIAKMEQTAKSGVMKRSAEPLMPSRKPCASWSRRVVHCIFVTKRDRADMSCIVI